MKLFRRRLSPPIYRYGPAFAFSRASVAYNFAKLQMASGVPRIEAIGITVEGDTTNLLGASDSQLLSGAVSIAVTSGQKYTVQCATGSITLDGAGSGTVLPGTPVTITAGSTTLTLTPTAAADYVQCENKAYATTWQIGGIARAAEALTIPITVLNPVEGMIEFDFIHRQMTPGYWLCGFGIPTEYIGISASTSYALRGTTKITSGSAVNTGNSQSLSAGTKYSVKLSWSAISGLLKLSVNGVVASSAAYSQISNLGSGLFMGASYANSFSINTNFSNLRISRRDRGNTEFSYTGPLKKDSKTTFLRNWKGAI